MDESIRGALRHHQRQEQLLRGESLSKLRDELTEAELIERHDALVEEAARTTLMETKMRFLERAKVYTDELARREAARQGERMEALTRSMHLLSAVGIIVAIIGVVLTAVTLLSGG
jgi:hypothetical protein